MNLISSAVLRVFTAILALSAVVILAACAQDPAPSSTQAPTASLESTAATPTTTPVPMPTVDRERVEEPPRGPGAEIGKWYPYTLYVHCGVRDAYFDGRRWMADPMLGNNNPPPGWTADDSRGVMELVREDLAVFKSVSGRTINFIPWPSDVEWTGCY